jgi:AmmeMemoRadiSam system protein B
MRRLKHRGTFYFFEKEEIINFIEENVKKIKVKEGSRAVIVPHAGYQYSGFCALHSFLSLNKDAKRILIFGVDHLGGCRKICVGSENWEGIFGEVKVDRKFVEKILDFENVEVNDYAHEYEHSIEVQIPFLEYFFKDFKIVPILLNNLTSEEIEKFVENLVKIVDEKTISIFSGDLIHHGEIYGFIAFKEKRKENQKKADMEIVKAILSLDLKKFLESYKKYPTVCGYYTFQAFIFYSKKLNLKPKLLCYYNSAEITNEEDLIVGYASIASY